jgi:hypothetical protein
MNSHRKDTKNMKMINYLSVPTLLVVGLLSTACSQQQTQSSGASYGGQQSTDQQVMDSQIPDTVIPEPITKPMPVHRPMVKPKQVLKVRPMVKPKQVLKVRSM